MKTPFKIWVSITVSVAVSGTLTLFIFTSVRGIGDDLVRGRKYNNVIQKAFALNVLVATFDLESGPRHTQQFSEVRTSLKKLLDGLTSSDVREESLIRQIQRNNRELDPLLDQFLAQRAEREVLQAEFKKMLSTQLWTKVRFISDDTSRLMEISESRIASAYTKAGFTMLFLLIALIAANAIISMISGRSIARAEEDLRQSESKYRIVAENPYDWEFWLSPEGKFLYGSLSCKKITGREPEEFLQDASLVRKIILPEDLPIFDRHRQEEEEEEEAIPQETQYRVVHTDGTIRWIGHVCKRIFDGDGQLLGIRGTNRDITARKRMEEELRESEERYRNVVQNTSAVILRVDPQGIIRFANERAVELFGFSEEELIGKYAVGTIIPEQETTGRNLAAMVDEILKKPDSFHSNENENMRKNGDRLWVEWTNSGMYDKKGRLTEFLAVGIDNTERRRAERALRQSEEDYRALFENLNSGAVLAEPIFDGEGRLADLRYLMANPTVKKHLGIARDELLGKLYSEVFHYPKRSPVFDIYERVLSTGEPFREEIFLPGLDGYFDMSIYRPDEGRLALVFSDISDRKKAEEISRQRTLELQHLTETLEQRVKDRTTDVERERRRLYEVLEAIPAMVSLLTPDYHVAFANRSFRERFGDSGGRHCYEFCFGRTEPCEFCETYNVLKTGKPHHWEVAAPDGNFIDAYDFPFTDVDGSPLILEMDVDITDRRRAEQELKEKARELADLSSQLVSSQENERRRVSYDLHDNVWQTLVAIRFEIERLFSRMGKEDEAVLHKRSKEVMADILGAVGKIRSMQGDLWPYVLDDIGIVATIDWYCREFEKNHSGLVIEKANGIDETEIPSSVKIVIYRIMQEAMSNVAKHSQASHVSLSLMKKGQGLDFTIQDNGIGFDPEETIAKRTPLGGLGLLSIKARTELSGGSFGIESAKGKGTTVRAFWPL